MVPTLLNWGRLGLDSIAISRKNRKKDRPTLRGFRRMGEKNQALVILSEAAFSLKGVREKVTLVILSEAAFSLKGVREKKQPLSS
jgi:hypothetical protein